ncbi:hypothetical protein [Phage vB_KsaM-C1]|nr:hypothetical protein [Phage vB_KsaM-C1]
MKTLNVSFQNRYGHAIEMAVDIQVNTPFHKEIEAVKDALLYAEIFDFRNIIIERQRKKVLMMGVECGIENNPNSDIEYDILAAGF